MQRRHRNALLILVLLATSSLLLSYYYPVGGSSGSGGGGGGGSVSLKRNGDSYNDDLSENQEHQLLRKMRSSFLPQPSFDFKTWSEKKSSYMFLHVGKAAGSTVYCKLTLPMPESTDFKFWCPGLIREAKETRKKNPVPPLYSQKYGERLHMTTITDQELHDSYKGPYDVFLVSLRNPLTRFISAYEYEKTKKNRWVQKSYPTFKQCFPNSVSVQNFLLNLGAKHGGENESNAVDHGINASSRCREVAINVTKGRVSFYRSHMTYNYQFYENQFLSAVNASSNEKTGFTRGHILAIRSEYLEEDFSNFEMLLQNGEVAVSHDNVTIPEQGTVGVIVMNSNSGKGNNAKLNSISSVARRILCRVLCEDIQAYKRFLFRAENLNEEMIINSIRDLQKYCPMERLEVQERCDETL